MNATDCLFKDKCDILSFIVPENRSMERQVARFLEVEISLAAVQASSLVGAVDAMNRSGPARAGRSILDTNRCDMR